MAARLGSRSHFVPWNPSCRLPVPRSAGTQMADAVSVCNMRHGSQLVLRQKHEWSCRLVPTEDQERRAGQRRAAAPVPSAHLCFPSLDHLPFPGVSCCAFSLGSWAG